MPQDPYEAPQDRSSQKQASWGWVFLGSAAILAISIVAIDQLDRTSALDSIFDDVAFPERVATSVAWLGFLLGSIASLVSGIAWLFRVLLPSRTRL